MMRRKVSLFTSLMLAASGLAACTSVFGGEDVKVRAVENMSSLTGAPRDRFYESAVSAIDARDYARALDYLQESRARDPRNVKALNALGVVYDKLGRFDLSARYYAQARAVDPDSRIVAENVGYSRILQGLLNPGQKIAVATIDLPPHLNDASPEQPTTVVADAPAAAAAAVAVSAPPSGIPATAERAKPGNAVIAAPVVLPATIASSKPQAEKMVTATSVPFAVVAPVAPGLEKPRNAVAAAIVPPATSPAVVVPPRKTALAVNRKVFTIGQPVKILNASGKKDRVGVVTRRLSVLGWTVRQSDVGHVQSTTTLFYPAQNVLAAKAMQRTLPFPVRLVPGAGASAMQLVIGRDYLSWKPRNARLATLWQKGTIVASLQKPSIRGAR